jgi:hypothetical protein
MTTDAKKPTRPATAPNRPAGDAVRSRAANGASSAMLAAQRAVTEAISGQAQDSLTAQREAAQAVVAAVRSMSK